MINRNGIKFLFVNKYVIYPGFQFEKQSNKNILQMYHVYVYFGLWLLSKNFLYRTNNLVWNKIVQVHALLYIAISYKGHVWKLHFLVLRYCSVMN